MTVTIVATVVHRLPPQCTVGHSYPVVLGFLNPCDEPANGVTVRTSYPVGTIEHANTVADTLAAHDTATITLEFTPDSGSRHRTVEISATLHHAGGASATVATSTTIIAPS